MYAVVRTGGKQYRVAPGDVIRVEKLAGEIGDKINFDDILMVGGEGDPKLGKPNVKGVKVVGKIVEQDRGKKIIVFKHKRRKGYRLKQGHRQLYTGVEIQSIESGKKTKKAKPKPVEEKAPETESKEETE